MKITVVIMAGGKGERFWPRSRRNLPKQFISLSEDGLTMIQHTAGRLLSMIEWNDMFVVTNSGYVDLVREQLPELPVENILAEPAARNTAPCIGFAAAILRKKYEEAVMIVLPADHLIKNNEMYIDTLTQAVEVAKEDKNLVTIGITPTHPETSYGYINFIKDESGAKVGVYSVKCFVEKPTLGVAKEYLASGQYLWNSGMFVWKLSSIMARFEALLPDTYRGLLEIGDAYATAAYEQVLYKCYEKFTSESVDYAIMERTDHIYTLPGSFGWDDVGNWVALERINKTNDLGNMVQGDVITINTKNSIIIGGKRLIASVGLDDVIVVDTDDALLICSKESSQDIKKVIENLKICNRSELL